MTTQQNNNSTVYPRNYEWVFNQDNSTSNETLSSEATSNPVRKQLLYNIHTTIVPVGTSCLSGIPQHAGSSTGCLSSTLMYFIPVLPSSTMKSCHQGTNFLVGLKLSSSCATAKVYIVLSNRVLIIMSKPGKCQQIVLFRRLLGLP